MPISMKERLDILQWASREWLELKRAIDTLSDAQIDAPNTVGGRSVRDVMVHLANRDDDLADILRDRDSAGQQRRTGPEHGAINSGDERPLTPFRPRSLEEAKEYFVSAHLALMNLMERSPSLSRELVRGTIEHYAKHRSQVITLRQRQSSG